MITITEGKLRAVIKGVLDGTELDEEYIESAIDDIIEAAKDVDEEEVEE